MSYGLFSNGEAALGSFAQFASMRSLIQDADGKNYLRLGSVVPAAFADPILLTRSDHVFLPHVNTTANSGSAGSYCDSGAIILFSSVSAGGYSRSTDNLATASTQTWPAGYTPQTPIRWTGTKFVVGATDSPATGYYMLSSTTGLTGSWTVSTILAAAPPAGSTFRLEFAPLAPAFMIAAYHVNTGAGGAFYTSSNSGTSFSAGTAVAGGYIGKPVCLGSGAGGKWVVPLASTSAAGATSVYTMPANFSAAAVLNSLDIVIPEILECSTDGTSIVAVNAATGADCYSSNGLDFPSNRQTELQAAFGGNSFQVTFCAGAFWKFGEAVGGTSVLRSVDGRAWFQKNTGFKALGFVTNTLKVVGVGNLQGGANNGHALADWNLATHVGCLTPFGYNENNSGSANGRRFPGTYTRIK